MGYVIVREAARPEMIQAVVDAIDNPYKGKAS